MAIFGHNPACRSQAVAIHHTTGVSAFGEDDTGGPIPGFHVHRVKFIKSMQCRVHMIDVLPGGWHQ